MRFGAQNTTRATIIDCVLVDILPNPHGNPYNVFAIKLGIIPHGVWNRENSKAITKCTMRWKDSRRPGPLQEAKCTIHGMRLLHEDELQVIIRITRPGSSRRLEKNEIVDLTPKPNKCEYDAMKRSLNKWKKQSLDKCRLLNILLDPGRDTSNNSWRIEDRGALINREWQTPRNICQLGGLTKTLNKEQKLALTRAESFAVSVCQGPPGTGKTRTLAAIAIVLAVKEAGAVVLCAPSNYAADGLSIALNNLLSELLVPCKALRIFSRTKARSFLDNGVDASKGHHFPVLHDLVRKSDKWLNDESIKDLDEIRKNVADKTEYLLTEAQIMALDFHISQLEHEIMKEFNIYVSTVGCVADQRLASTAEKGGITTVVLDEASQLNQPQTMHMLTLSPSRIIFAGDPMQLSATILSYAASTAGLHLSLIDMLPGMGDSLSLHAAMEDTLRAASHASRDSKLTYEDKLIDAKVVLERKVRPNYGELLNATGGSRIVILDHKFFEKNEPITNGYYNIGEVNEVSRLVQTLLDKGIPSEDITILTFYEMQRQELLRAMPCKSDIRNVDAFQGRENRVVIISFVRSNTSPKASVGFLNSINRINVALSRAQEFLFIVWNTEFFRRSHLQHFKKLCKLVHHCPKLSDLNL